MNQAHEQAVRDFLKLFHTEALDIEAVRAALAPDARYQPIVPLSAPFAGAEAICAELQRQYTRYDQCDCVIGAIASNARQVFTERVDVVKMAGDGREVRVHVTGVFELDDNARITSWREYWDALDVARRIGVPYEDMARIMDAQPLEPAA